MERGVGCSLEVKKDRGDTLLDMKAKKHLTFLVILCYNWRMTKTYDIRDVRNEASMSLSIVGGGCEIEIEDGPSEIHLEISRRNWIVCHGSKYKKGTWEDGGILEALLWALEAQNERLDQN